MCSLMDLLLCTERLSITTICPRSQGVLGRDPPTVPEAAEGPVRPGVSSS